MSHNVVAWPDNRKFTYLKENNQMGLSFIVKRTPPPPPPWTLKKDLYTDGSQVIDQIRSSCFNSTDGTLFVGTGLTYAQIWRSSDGGNTWTEVEDLTSFPSHNQTRVTSLLHDSTSNVMIAGCGSTASIFRSTDGGDTWSWIQDLPNQFYVDSLIYDSVNNTFVAGCEGDDVYYSTDAGLTWNFGQDLAGEVLSLGFDPSRGRLFAGVSAAGTRIYTSDDGGDVWTQRVSFNNWGPGGPGTGTSLTEPIRVHGMVYDPVYDVIITAQGSNAGGAQIHTSKDGGITWGNTLYFPSVSGVPGPQWAHAITYNADIGRTYVAFDNLFGGWGNIEIWYSDDGGDNWTLDQDFGIDPGGSADVGNAFSMAYDSTNNRQIVTFGYNAGSPGGTIWSRGN